MYNKLNVRRKDHQLGRWGWGMSEILNRSIIGRNSWKEFGENKEKKLSLSRMLSSKCQFFRLLERLLKVQKTFLPLNPASTFDFRQYVLGNKFYLSEVSKKAKNVKLLLRKHKSSKTWHGWSSFLFRLLQKNQTNRLFRSQDLSLPCTQDN